MLFAIAMMYLVGLTLNMISLFALILCLGIVVDDAIVVGEHADFRARRLGENPTQAAERSALRMGLPVFTATITTVLAFGGLVAIGGRFGSLIADIPFTVIVVLLASLVECFLILPNHMRHALTAKMGKVPWYDWPSLKFNDGFRYLRERFFRPATKFSIFMRYPLIAGALALLAISVSLLVSGEVKWRFFNAPETGRLTGNIAMLPSATRVDTMDMLRELDRATLAVARDFEARHGSDPLTFVLLQVGGNSGRGLSGSENKDPDQLGSISVELIDADLRDYSSYAFVGALQGEVRRHPLLETLSFRNWASGPGSDSLSISLFGSDIKNLKAASESLVSKLSSFAEISGLEDNQAYDKDELILQLKPQGSSLGFSIDKVGSDLYQRLNGIEAASFLDGKRTSKIIVGLPKDSIEADFIEKTHLRSPNGNYVKLSDIVSVSSKFGFSSISRENGQRLITVSGELSEDDPEQASLISEQIRGDILPGLEERFGITTEWGGLAAQERSFLNDAVIGFSLCLLGIYLTLTWVFESWLRPIVVMAIIPFGIIGTLWGHYLWNIPLSMFSIIGLIGMTGIIINDSIVLITTIDEYSNRRGLISAIIDATSDRLRPVLLTTLTTVLGLLPLLFETSKDAQFLKPTVITLVYGLGFGMFLVLFLVPAIVAIQLDIGSVMKASRRLLFSRKFSFSYTALIWLFLALMGLIYFLGFGLILLFGDTSQIYKFILPDFSPLIRSTIFMIFSSILLISFSFIIGRWVLKK
jgi:multidrug efflux pump subunit AcrB